MNSMAAYVTIFHHIVQIHMGAVTGAKRRTGVKFGIGQ